MYVEFVNTLGIRKKVRLAHMVLHEQVLAKEYIEKYGSLYLSFDSNVLVGTLEEPPYPLSPQDEKDYKYLYSKKIDLVGYTPTEIHTFEVKLRGGHSFYSQILLYKTLYEEKFNPEKPVVACGICAKVDIDVLRYLQSQNARVFVFSKFEHLLR
jgi:hypothetical protein